MCGPLNMSTSTPASPEPREPGLLARAAMIVLACVLTVSIAGSALFLWQARSRAHDRYARIQKFVDRLGLLSPQEIAERAAALRETPEDARRVIPAVLKRLRHERSPRLRLACVRL